MKKFLGFLNKIIPSRSWVPLASIVLFNFFVYYGSSFTVRHFPAENFYDFSTPIDDIIGFVPFFITFYILAYAHWFIGYIVLSHDSSENFYKVATADIIAKAICLACFLIIPTTIARPEITGNGVFDLATKLIYASDKPYNLFPSIHCLESWVVFRYCLKMKLPKWYKISMGIFAFLVFASVVFVKQHFFVDIPAGILVVEIGALITKYTKLDVFFRNKVENINNRRKKKKLSKEEHSEEKEFSLEK